MPATSHAPQESPAAEPYSLIGAPKSPLAALTVTTLKSHLQHYRLPTTGKKVVLVDRLHDYIASLSETAPAGNNPTPSTESSQSANSMHLTVSSAQSTRFTTQSPNSSIPPLPQQLVNQLTAYLQQCQNPLTGNQASNNTDDENLSVASGSNSTTVSVPAQVITPLTVVTTTLSPPVVTRTSLPTAIPVVNILPPPPNPTRTTPPVIPTRIRNKIAKGEYIDFTTLLSKAMFDTDHSLSQQKVTFQLNPDGESFAIQPVATTGNLSIRISSFATWMEAWNVYLPVRTSLNPSCAVELIHYQCIITTANTSHPLTSWLKYDQKFRTKAASDPSLRWDTRDKDLWLECFTANAMQSLRWLCPHCGSVKHFPDRCPFCSPPSSSRVVSSQTGNRPPGQPSRSDLPQKHQPICQDYNNGGCHRAYCNCTHKCDCCGDDHPVRSCPFRVQPRPH